MENLNVPPASSNLLKTVCNLLEDGTLSHSSLDDILNKQLSAEGVKRADSFVFELLFKRRLKALEKDTTDLVISFNWIVGFDNKDTPCYWFKLQDDDADWNCADEMLVKHLLNTANHTNKVHKAKYCHPSNIFLISELTLNGWTNWQSAQNCLSMLPNKKAKTTIRNTNKTNSQTDKNHYNIAVDWLTKKTKQENYFKEEIIKISLQRRFINCLLSPILGGDPADLDAITLSNNTNIKYLEIKRKYPAYKFKHFGIDETPHIKIMNYLAKHQVGMSHIILVPPCWEKESSPIRTLNNGLFKKHWTWLGANLDNNAITNLKMHTYGSNSGQRDMDRDQYAIDWKVIFNLNNGLPLDKQAEQRIACFLKGALPIPYAQANFSELKSRYILSYKHEFSY
jgi:hypothetical protein